MGWCFFTNFKIAAITCFDPTLRVAPVLRMRLMQAKAQEVPKRACLPPVRGASRQKIQVLPDATRFVEL
jgi:hypothetical protein